MTKKRGGEADRNKKKKKEIDSEAGRQTEEITLNENKQENNAMNRHWKRGEGQ